MKNCLLQLLVQVTGISNRTLTELSTISSITHRVGVLGYDSILKKKMFRVETFDTISGYESDDDNLLSVVIGDGL